MTLSTNAKGCAQIEITLRYANPDAMMADAPAHLGDLINSLQEMLAARGIPMAGQQG